MKTAIIGAGPAGLVAAKTAAEHGHEVCVFEKLERLGGVWNPQSGGAYKNVLMQNSKLSFHYSDFKPEWVADFQTLADVHRYLQEYATTFAINRIRFGCTVEDIDKVDAQWKISYRCAGQSQEWLADRVIVTTGEHWVPRLPSIRGFEDFKGEVFSSRAYHQPTDFIGQNVLVVGGGVSGADIASDLVGSADTVNWSVRHLGLYLPRHFGTCFNDDIFSYIGRFAALEQPYDHFVAFLKRILPEYMQMYEASGLLPRNANNTAIHVNEKIIPNVYQGNIAVRPEIACVDAAGLVHFADGSTGAFDAIVFCTGYEIPDYSFIRGFDRTRLYEHFFYSDDPTLAIINPPIDTSGFGAALPYFEMIAGWVANVFSGKRTLPPQPAMREWCRENMANLETRRFYDSWIETIRIGVMSGAIPHPEDDFAQYWRIVASRVCPAYFRNPPDVPHAGVHDAEFDLGWYRVRLLAALSSAGRLKAFENGAVSRDELLAAEQAAPNTAICALLPYDHTFRLSKPRAEAVTA